MRGDRARKMPAIESFPYGGKIDNPISKAELKRLYTALTANPILAVRLANALGLKDLPGHPGFAVMDKVVVMADMFQAGFANYSRVNGKRDVVTVGSTEDTALAGIFAAPARSNLVTSGRNLFGNSPIYVNTDRDMRVSNAWVRVNHEFPNPNTDTAPLSLHCSFLLDGNIAWESIQNNLVSSSSDGSFMFQTADSNWDGIVPAGSTFTFSYFAFDGEAGGVAYTSDLDISCGLMGLAVPMGAQIPR